MRVRMRDLWPQTGGNDYLNQFDNITDAFDLNLELSSLPEEAAGCILVGGKCFTACHAISPLICAAIRDLMRLKCCLPCCYLLC